MEIKQIMTCNAYAANCYLLVDSGHAYVVDPSAKASEILQACAEQKCTPDGILLTHGHFDHISAVDELRNLCPELPVYIHKGDAPMLTDGEKNAYTFFFGEECRYRAADRLLSEGDVITVGQTKLVVMHTPGHSPGSVCYLDEADGTLITGDTLFSDNIGRWDLWEGDYATLRQSLGRLNTLPRTYTIYPGHGEPAKLGAALSRVSVFLP